jgi:rhodanese-related sulfurtransferase
MSHATLTPAELAGLLAATPGLTVLDVRSPAEFSAAHATPARNLPLPDLSPAALAAAGHADPAAPVYLLCQSGRRALAAADRLAAVGFKRPVVVLGGTEAWLAAGLPAVHGTGKAISLERQVRIAAGGMVFIGALLAWFVHPGFVWLSGFVGAGLVFAGVTDTCGMGLLLAKAPWNR